MLSAEHKKRKMKSSGYANIFLLVSFESVLTGFTGATGRGRGRDTARLAGSGFITQESHSTELQLKTWETAAQPRGAVVTEHAHFNG